MHDGLVVVPVSVVHPGPAAPALGEALLPRGPVQQGQLAPVVAELGLAGVLEMYRTCHFEWQFNRS